MKEEDLIDDKRQEEANRGQKEGGVGHMKVVEILEQMDRFTKQMNQSCCQEDTSS